MKLLPPVLLLCVVTGCSKNEPQATGNPAQTSLEQKLQAMTPAERTEYAKTHLDEFSAAAKPPVPPSK